MPSITDLGQTDCSDLDLQSPASMVMTHITGKNQGQKAVGSKGRKQKNGRTDRQTDKTDATDCINDPAKALSKAQAPLIRFAACGFVGQQVVQQFLNESNQWSLSLSKYIRTRNIGWIVVFISFTAVDGSSYKVRWLVHILKRSFKRKVMCLLPLFLLLDYILILIFNCKVL